MKAKKQLTKNDLQGLYNMACWYGYVNHDGETLIEYTILKLARQKGFELEYPEVQ